MFQVMNRTITLNHQKQFYTILLFLIFMIPGSAQCEYSEEGRFYPNPGIVAYRDGRWVGSDHLYNITDKIGVAVEIVKPNSLKVPFTEEMLKARVADIFKKAKITPQAERSPGKPPLPFFHILVMIQPIDKGYVAYTEGRLLEQIHVDRVKMDEQAVMQAITWESESLVLTPTEQLENQVNKSVDEIAKTFADRYRFYEDIKFQIHQN